MDDISYLVSCASKEFSDFALGCSPADYKLRDSYLNYCAKVFQKSERRLIKSENIEMKMKMTRDEIGE